MSRVRRDLVVIGASAGGVTPLKALMAGLPANFPAAVLVVLHVRADGPSALASILDRAGPLPARSASHGEPIRPGTVLVAPPGRHLLVEDDAVVLTDGPTESGHRPSVNATFRSAAIAAGPRVLGVILSGALDDGAAGLHAVTALGGLAIVQDPADAMYPGMPRAALELVDTDQVLPAGEIAPALDKLSRVPVDPGVLPQPPPHLLLDDRIARAGVQLGALPPETTPSEFTCPDCGGTLTELGPGQYRCHIGHAWSAKALLFAQDQELRRALGTALRSLDERATLSRRMRQHLRTGGPGLAERVADSEREWTDAADTLRRFLLAIEEESE
ncbi:chemotaxis protein CheB [Amycolatopsis jiangsuensis]|uniref:protein-glutamate methylesterase n=1 Tax=Amycolatopsis jiangsuensis TaxID=1181879 RepID=A0A840J762_9PSEU|nr:chemotaxis protein CheB [Amycolatopsis jiangsuensis]MBB4689217.1 two-component system chemotaxis response regulator CheB [Amycolatopsis jiangsuensis]